MIINNFLSERLNFLGKSFASLVKKEYSCIDCKKTIRMQWEVKNMITIDLSESKDLFEFPDFQSPSILIEEAIAREFTAEKIELIPS